MPFIINFEISLVNFLNVLGFLLLASEKKRRLYVFNLLGFFIINIYSFFDLLFFRRSWYMVTDLGIFLIICSNVCGFFKVVFVLIFSPISLTRKFRRKKTRKHHNVFFFEISWPKFFLKPFIFTIQF